MENQGSVSGWLERAKAGDERAAQELWERYFEELASVARGRLGKKWRKVEDEEDAVLAALGSFFEGARRGRFTEIKDRDNLWPLLLTITERKAIKQVNRQLAAKRGGGQILGEASLGRSNDSSSEQFRIDKIQGPEPTPETIVALREQCEELLKQLQDENLRHVAVLKLHGYTNAEIAVQIGVVERTVERKLKLIRERWSEVSFA